MRHLREWIPLMPPITSRDFQKVAAQRLTAAETLLRQKPTLDAQYLGSYAVECSLKALILHLTPDPDKPDKLLRITDVTPLQPQRGAGI